MNIFKWLSIPSGEKIEVKAYESWIVRWHSIRYDGRLSYSQEEAEIFTTEEDAKLFVNQIKEARKLLKDSCFRVELTKN